MNNVLAELALGTPDKNLYGNPGETQKKIISIQNIVDTPLDTTIKITITKGADYISFPGGDLIEIKANETKFVTMDVTIPSGANTGDVYEASIVIKQISEQTSSQGTVSLSSSIGEDFKIHVNEQKDTNNKILIISTILIVFILLLIWILIRTIKNNK